ncbi:hypothetical protein EJ06DRAFT_562428 [Trichodelitschia bisporula]|uniref:RINT-1 family protein-like protein n=1 Tax=Trichodelitschia bisporula TaxID=703511 RepID=A0A6G1HVX0_9PEZI|nr:hypothetical protein EJ06DRAFT_562428 [Trichodelitschia bisporula]
MARDVRVGDYLDDKLQTPADFDLLRELLDSVSAQRKLLEDQIHVAQKDLESAKRAASEHDSSLRARVDRFERAQADIDRRLLIATNSDTSDAAVKRFESSMDKMRRLEIANGYVEMLREVDRLSNEGVARLGTHDAEAIDAYRHLHSLSVSLQPLQDAAEGAAPHLLDSVAQKTKALHDRIQKSFIGELETLLKKISWPSPDATVPPTMVGSFRATIGKLLELQKPELEAREEAREEAGNSPATAPLVLLPLQAMVHPLELAFRYHFETDRPTNRLDRPEYFLFHVTDKLLGQYNDFMDDNLQPVLLEKFRGTSIARNPAYIDATSAFVTALLPMVRAKIFTTLPKVSGRPQLLSHLIHEVMKFDTTLRDEWRYEAGAEGECWRGLAWEVLSANDWFEQWLKVEKDFALARYQEIVDAPDSFDLDYDGVDAKSTKPTKAAIRVNDLLEATTGSCSGHYRTLTSFSQKLRFLIDIQISIFDLFHERLADGLAAYLSRTSTIGRTSREEQITLQGVAGLESLCRIYGSAEYLERAMRDWSDDVFFLSLWSELQHRAATRGQNISGSMNLAQVAARTSRAVSTPPDELDDPTATGALFDETAASYTRLRERTEAVIADLLINNVRNSLSAYSRINPWSSLAPSTSVPVPAARSPDSLPSLPPTPELDNLLTTLSTHFEYLAKALGAAPLHRVARKTAHAIDNQLFEHVLLRREFSAAGAGQFGADVQAVRGCLVKLVSVAVGEGLRRVVEGAWLVGLEGGRGEEGDDGGDGGKVTLWGVEKRIFGDGEEARVCLGELGLVRVGVTEARKVLARRVELSG